MKLNNGDNGLFLSEPAELVVDDPSNRRMDSWNVPTIEHSTLAIRPEFECE